MPKPLRYQDVYPTEALLKSSDLKRAAGARLLTLEYFEAEPATMPEEIFAQHHILLNLNSEPHRVENWRNGVHRDFTYHENEVIVTPAGMTSGWRWFIRSKVIVVTLDPEDLERFALTEVGTVLRPQQLADIPQFIDPELVGAGRMVLDALRLEGAASGVMFESLARVFLIKLLQRYGESAAFEARFSASFTPEHFQRVLAFIADNFGDTIKVQDLAQRAGLSVFHFARLFKATIGQTPHQFVTSYRLEQAKKCLADPTKTLIDIALTCGFADQAHFCRTFKQHTGKTPKQWRGANER